MTTPRTPVALREKAEREESLARQPRTVFFGFREQANAWKRAATAWTSAALLLEATDPEGAGTLALRALHAQRNADLTLAGKLD